jgi:hypothetical protein
LLLLFLLPASGTLAQIPYLEALPWSEASDSLTGGLALFHWERFADAHTGWHADRVGVTGLVPLSGAAIFFRESFVLFDTDNLSALRRWPEIAGEETTTDWPGERQISGWGRPEVGMFGLVDLPLLPPSQLALALGLPAGRDDLYPFSSVSVPARLGLRRVFKPAAEWQAAVSLTGILELDSGGEQLQPGAFPSGAGWALTAARRLGTSRLELLYQGMRLGGRASDRLGARLWLELGSSGQQLGVQTRWEMAGTTNRPFAWSLALIWRLAGPSATAGTGEPPP